MAAKWKEVSALNIAGPMDREKVERIEEVAGVECALMRSNRLKPKGKDAPPDAPDVPYWEIVAAMPDPMTYKRFRREVNDKDRMAEAPEGLLRACVVWPDPETFERLMRTIPSIAEACIPGFEELMGTKIASIEKR